MNGDLLPRQAAVKISQVMGLPSLVALGVSVTVGLGILTLLGHFMRLSPGQAAGAYLLLVGIAIPVILTYAERAAVLSGSGGAYNLARAGEQSWLAYATGWLLLGGYLCLIALLGWGLGLHVNLILTQLFNHTADPSTLAVAIIGLVALNNLLGTNRSWQTRTGLIAAGILLLWYIILRNLFAPLADSPPPLDWPWAPHAG